MIKENCRAAIDFDIKDLYIPPEFRADKFDELPKQSMPLLGSKVSEGGSKQPRRSAPRDT